MQVEARGLVFDVQVSGPEDAPAVLLLHGFPQSSHCWRHVDLPGLRVIAPDQRGYSPGARPTDVEAYRVGELAADALAILDALGVGRAHVVGHDWGAAVAWQVGCRHPSRVLTLTAVSVPHPRAFIEALRTDADQRQRSLYMRDFAKPGYQLDLGSLFGGLPAVDVEHVLTRAEEPGAVEAWLRWYAAQRLEDIADTPASVVPTMHVWSDGDVALGRAGALGTADWVTGPYRFEALEGVSHWIPEEAADQLSALLREHLR